MTQASMRESVPGELNGRLSPFLRRQRMKMVTPFFWPGQRILDIGCGLFSWEGRLPPGCFYSGVDREQDVIAENQSRCEHTFTCMDIEGADWRACGQAFDLVVLLAVVEHLRDPAGLLRAIWPQLADGASVVLTTPHPAGNKLMRVGGALGLLSDDKDEHGDLFDRRDLEAIAGAAGARLVKYRRFLLGLNQLAVIKR